MYLRDLITHVNTSFENSLLRTLARLSEMTTYGYVTFSLVSVRNEVNMSGVSHFRAFISKANDTGKEQKTSRKGIL